MTMLFEVTEEGIYTISFTGSLPIVSSTTTSQPIRIPVDSQPVTMRLQKSAAAFNKRNWFDLSDNKRIHSCDAAQQWVIQQTTKQAAAIALNAKKAVPLFNSIGGYWPNTTLYNLYFNDKSQQTVFNIFDKISNYDLLKNPGIGLTFYCNTDVGHSAYCAADGLLGYAPAFGAYSYVTLCDHFFNDIWSSTLCSQPGTRDPPDGITVAQFQNPAMQAGVIIHEMLHVSLVVGTNTIIDGPDPNEQGGDNYYYHGVRQNAMNAAMNNDAPLKNSQNFVFFAQEATNLVAPLPCNYFPYGGSTLSLCKTLPKSPACSACTCGGFNPNPKGS